MHASMGSRPNYKPVGVNPKLLAKAKGTQSEKTAEKESAKPSAPPKEMVVSDDDRRIEDSQARANLHIEQAKSTSTGPVFAPLPRTEAEKAAQTPVVIHNMTMPLEMRGILPDTAPANAASTTTEPTEEPSTPTKTHSEITQKACETITGKPAGGKSSVDKIVAFFTKSKLSDLNQNQIKGLKDTIADLKEVRKNASKSEQKKIDSKLKRLGKAMKDVALKQTLSVSSGEKGIQKINTGKIKKAMKGKSGLGFIIKEKAIIDNLQEALKFIPANSSEAKEMQKLIKDINTSLVSNVKKLPSQAGGGIEGIAERKHNLEQLNEHFGDSVDSYEGLQSALEDINKNDQVYLKYFQAQPDAYIRMSNYEIGPRIDFATSPEGGTEVVGSSAPVDVGGVLDNIQIAQKHFEAKVGTAERLGLEVDKPKIKAQIQTCLLEDLISHRDVLGDPDIDGIEYGDINPETYFEKVDDLVRIFHRLESDQGENKGFTNSVGKEGKQLIQKKMEQILRTTEQIVRDNQVDRNIGFHVEEDREDYSQIIKQCNITLREMANLSKGGIYHSRS